MCLGTIRQQIKDIEPRKGRETPDKLVPTQTLEMVPWGKGVARDRQ